jgi:hypothetical protein
MTVTSANALADDATYARERTAPYSAAASPFAVPLREGGEGARAGPSLVSRPQGATGLDVWDQRLVDTSRSALERRRAHKRPGGTPQEALAGPLARVDVVLSA